MAEAAPEVVNLLTNIDTDLDNINGNTDDVEAKLDSVISELEDIDANTDTVESELQDVNTELDSIDSLIDELEDALASVATDQIRIDIIDEGAVATETTLASIDANTDEVETKLDTTISELQDIEADTEANTTELQDINTELDSIDALIDELEDALQSVGTDQLRIDIENNNAGLATENTLSSIDTLVDELEDALTSVGTDQLRVDLENNNAGLLESSDQPLDVSAAEVDVDINSQTLSQVGTDLQEVGGTTQTGVDIANKIEQLADSLQTAFAGDDQLRVDLQNDNLTSNLDTDIAEQSLAQLTSVIEADDQAGNTAEIQAEELGGTIAGSETALFTVLANALSGVDNRQVRTDIENNNAGLATETTLSTISNDVDEVETKLDTVISELQDIEADLEAERDAKFIASETISANGTIKRELDALGGSAVSGQFISTGIITLKVQWLDAPGGTLIREQNVINNAIADDWKTFELEPTSPYINLILEDESGTDQTVNASYHYN